MRVPFALLCALLICGFQGEARASDMKEMMGYLLASSLPTQPLSSGALDVQVAPGYDEYSLANNCLGCDGQTNSQWTMNGFGASASADYALSDHWGVGLLGGYGQLSGIDFSGNSANANGTIASAVVIYDPFSGDNFRMPFIGGLGYRNLIENDAGNMIYNAQGFSYSAGIAPQFNTGFLRWTLFGYIVSGTPNAETLQGLSGLSRNSAANTAAGGGITVAYRPLKFLSFTYIPSWATEVGSGEKNNVYVFSFSHRFYLKNKPGQKKKSAD